MPVYNDISDCSKIRLKRAFTSALPAVTWAERTTLSSTNVAAPMR